MEKTDRILPVTHHLLSWYRKNKRQLPWRETNDPYLVWVSEIILQQTRVAQGRDYYARFIHRFPNVQTLAAASEDEVLLVWQGLGYYSRARNMHAAAKEVVERFNGKFPTRHDDILSLRGVGEYTAAAISSIAYNEPHAAVDGNVLRVIARLFAIEEPIHSSKGKKAITGITRSLLPVEEPANFNQAIMDFGSLVCTPSRPACDNCPLHDFCLARSQDRVAYFPVNKKKKRPKERYLNYFHILHGSTTYIVQRTKQDIWKNLYEFPLVETTSPVELQQLWENTGFKKLFAGMSELLLDTPLKFKHQLSHQVIYACYYRVVLLENSVFNPPEGILRIEHEQLEQYPIARLTRKYLESMDNSCWKIVEK